MKDSYVDCLWLAGDRGLFKLERAIQAMSTIREIVARCCH